jgi:flagellar biosynthesis/type III secretory pathway M-ring protein FliF/YscJ
MLSLLLADTPALPLDEAGKYVAGAYVVFVVLLVIYVAIMASKLARIERELREVAEIAEDRAAPGRGPEAPSISDSLASQGSRGGGD